MGRLISYAKSIAILGLAALAVYMAMQLWFVSITNRSFLPYLQARFASSAPDGAGQFVRPYRIVYGSGDGSFDIMYSGVYNSDFWHYGQLVISELFQNGSFVTSTETDHDLLLLPGVAVLIFEYAFDMDATIFSQTFGRTGATFSNAGLTGFTAIAVHPPHEYDNAVNVFFINGSNTWQFSITPTAAQMRDDVFEIEIPSSYGAARSFAVMDDSLHFMPTFTQNFAYNPITVTNPYETQAGFLHLSVIGEQIEHFFSNPSSITQGLSGGGIYTFSNLTTVVRYHPWDVIEYTSFRTLGRTNPTSLIEDFSAAVAFINADPNINVEFHLAGYENIGRGHVFKFGYTINNFPLELAEWFTGPGCTNPLLHPIEITVDNGRVIRYRRVAFDFAVSSNTFVHAGAELLYEETTLGFSIGDRPFMRLQAIGG